MWELCRIITNPFNLCTKNTSTRYYQTTIVAHAVRRITIIIIAHDAEKLTNQVAYFELDYEIELSLKDSMEIPTHNR